MVRAMLFLGLLGATAGCGGTSSALELHRCQADLKLHDLVVEVGVPPQGHGWGTASSAEAMENTIFDSHQETSLTVDDPNQFVSAVCSRLQQQLQSTCTVTSFRSGGQFCLAETTSPPAATTGADGVYFKRSSQGRISLVATPLADGRIELAMAATEWPD